MSERAFAIETKNCFADSTAAVVTHHVTHMKCDNLLLKMWVNNFTPFFSSK